MKFFKRLWVKIVLGFLGALFLLLAMFYFAYPPVKNIGWGVNFSPDFAAYLGLDSRQFFNTILTELNPKYVRLMAYWEDLEPQPEKFDFSSTDYFLSRAQEQKVKVILILGRKQPRWPECHQPDWYNFLSARQKDAELLDMLRQAVEHFKMFSSVEMWQIENEPYFPYGPDCPTITVTLFKKELALVKSLDSRPIVVTDSGEKGAWLPVALSGGDVFGSTLYRTVYQDNQKRYLTYALPPFFYRIRAGMNRLLTSISHTIGVELQAEPWFNGTVFSTPWTQQSQLMNPKIFYANINYAKQAGLDREYFWGVEWWYWAKLQGHSEMWDAAKQFFDLL